MGMRQPQRGVEMAKFHLQMKLRITMVDLNLDLNLIDENATSECQYKTQLGGTFNNMRSLHY